jgi:hypothetical protein
MIIFLMALVSKEKSKDWDLTTQLLQGTLDSLTNQTDQNFKVLVGCHEIPSVRFSTDKIHFVRMDYSPQGELGNPPIRDIYIKWYTALHQHKAIEFDYCMQLDADDRVHKNLVAYLNTQPFKDAWIISKGSEIDYGSRQVYQRNNIDQICGSTVILSRQAVGVPQSITREELHKFYFSHQSHSTIRSFCLERGFNLGFIPFHAVQYIQHRSNLSDLMFRKGNRYNQIKKIIKLKIFSKRISSQELEDFGYHIQY